jgi:hypothetical protein
VCCVVGQALLDSSSSGSSYPAGTDWIAIVNTKSGGQGGKELLAKVPSGIKNINVFLILINVILIISLF